MSDYGTDTMDEGYVVYADELDQPINDLLEEMDPHDLRSLLCDAGMVGDAAEREAKNRGWEFSKTIVADGDCLMVSVKLDPMPEELA